MNHGRRYREEPSRPIPVWNGILEHLDRIGMAIWLYLWCLDRITREENGVGYVLGGAPVKIEQMVDELGRSYRAIRRDLKALRPQYLKLRWTPYGYVIQVLNSQKFGIWKPLSSPARNGHAATENGLARDKSGRAVTENGLSKEDSAVAAVDTAVKQQPAALPNLEDSVWRFLEINPCGPPQFRSILDAGWAGRNGGPYSILIGDALDSWKAIEGQNPKDCAPLYRALSKLRESEKATAKPGSGIHVFTAEEIPA